MRQRKGTPFRHVKHDTLDTIAGRYFRAWYHPTKGKRWQQISQREYVLTKIRKAQAKPQQGAHAAAAA